MNQFSKIKTPIAEASILYTLKIANSITTIYIKINVIYLNYRDINIDLSHDLPIKHIDI